MVGYSQSIPSTLLQTGAAGTVFTSGASNDIDQATWAAPPNIPIGGIIAWLKSLTGTPSLPESFVECNGQTLSDSESVYDGEVIPDLNGTPFMLRGGSTSGSTGGADSINLSHIKNSDPPDDLQAGSSKYDNHSFSNLPAYYQVVWIVRIK